ncbi:MAG: DUF6430 domain-containing protein [Clostridiales bacterium]|nr:DUF6430 domain-containing protein [Clostridiales bacterium]
MEKLLQGKTPSTLVCILASIVILLLVFIIFGVYATVRVIRKEQYELMEVSDGHHVYVQYGDVFSPDEVKNPSERRNIIIPVNRCFDTKIDDDLVSSRTLHGICMRRLYDEGLYTEETLSAEIQKFLGENVQTEPELIPSTKKRSGNLKRYPAGTVAEIKVSDTCTYFFLALSWFDRDLHANTSDEEYVVALVRLLQWCNIRSQKYPVVMPLIGAGAADTRKSEKDILEYLIKLIQMNRSLVNSDMHIIVRSSGKDSIGIAGL